MSLLYKDRTVYRDEWANPPHVTRRKLMLRSVQRTYDIEECSRVDLSSQIHDSDFRIEAPHYGAPNWARVIRRRECSVP